MTHRLAVVVAHPDDDTFGCAGTVALHADDPGFRFVLVHSTNGEAGMISDPALATRETLGEVRQEEDRRSWTVLGREPDRHEWLGYPDGSLAEFADELVERLVTIFRDERPDVVISFGPDGVTGHPDHIAAGRAAAEAFHRVRGEGGDGFSRLFQTAIPQTSIDELNARLVADGKEPFDPTQIFHPRGVPDDTIGLVVDTSAVAERVVAALREHKTQANDMAADMTEDDLLRIASSEHAVRAWPSSESGDPVLRDVFEDLD
ncbi:MAG: PIG-L family deacetylase [Actinomycetota bacterium]|nr:PIG-L family deacetylase [Actinomycetota bacterium]